MDYKTKKAAKLSDKYSDWLDQLICFSGNGFLYAGDMLGDSRSIKKLKEMGLITQSKSGWYLLTIDGLDLLDSMGCIHS